jgi:hypothetical protein
VACLVEYLNVGTVVLKELGKGVSAVTVPYSDGYVANSHPRSNEPTIALQQGRSVISLRSARLHFRPVPGVRVGVQLRAVRVEVQERSQSSRLVGPGRGVGPVGPVGPRAIQVRLPVNCWCKLLKKLFHMIVICRGCN